MDTMELVSKNWMTLTPAYGDHKTGKDAKTAWEGGKDWRTGLFDGEQVINREQFKPGTKVILRFCGARKTTNVTA